jgi:hypothetical protein
MWFTDNEAAQRAIVKGHSSSRLGDQILTRWWLSSTWPMEVVAVRSACQRADNLSRSRRDVVMTTRQKNGSHELVLRDGSERKKGLLNAGG